MNNNKINKQNYEKLKITQIINTINVEEYFVQKIILSIFQIYYINITKG